MAYDAELEDEDQDEEEQGGGEVIAGQSSELGGGGGGSGASSQPGAPTRSGSFTNLMDYVKSNESDGGRMGQQVKTGIQNRANEAQNSGSEFQQRAGEMVSQGSVVDQGINQDLSSGAARIKNDADKRAQFDRQYNASYQGPNDASEVQGYSDTGSKFNTIQDRARNAQTNQGREAILQDEYKRPTYTRGEQQLDSFIMGASNQGQNALSDIKQNYSNYGNNWDNLLGTINQGIGTAKQNTEKTRQDTRAAVDQAKAQQEANFQNYTNQIKQQQANQLQDLKMRVLQGDKDARAQVGLADDFYFPNIDEAITASGQQGLGGTATPEEIANYQALLDMSGLSGGYNDFSTPNSYFNVNKDLAKLSPTATMGAGVMEWLQRNQQQKKAAAPVSGGQAQSDGNIVEQVSNRLQDDEKKARESIGSATGLRR